VVVRTCDDEERIGRVVHRLARHLRQLGREFELLVVDEGSGDNTLFVTAMCRREVPELEVVHAAPDEGWLAGCLAARGHLVLLHDARVDAPLGPIAYALSQLAHDKDVVAVHERYLLLRRVRAWRAFDALSGPRDLAALERRFLRRARRRGLACLVTERPAPSRWQGLAGLFRVRAARGW
jgi:glycosyltransferase involved in cell wall biosynthesis